MAISGLNTIYRNRFYENISAVKKQEKAERGGNSLLPPADETTEQKTDSIELSAEGLRALEREQEARETASADTSEEEIQKAADPGASEEEIQGAADPDVSEEKAATDKTPESSDGSGGKVAVNEGKRLRQIAAAKDQAQIQQVLTLLRKDLSDCKAGKQKGWCDDSEIAKVEALISRAQSRMSQVPRQSDDDQDGLDAFAMASLM